MQGCLALAGLALGAYICWEIFVEFLGEVGWFWGILITLIIGGIFLSKK